MRDLLAVRSETERGFREASHTASMALPHARDLVEPTMFEHAGELWLKAGGLVFSDASGTTPLHRGDKISIGKDGYNEWRKIETEGVFSTEIPSRGRVLVSSNEGEIIYDSLMDGQTDMALSEGCYVCFIGDAGDLFEPLFGPRRWTPRPLSLHCGLFDCLDD
ncbi:MAG: hypothetical protein VB144_01425 [Clostridia bacterium]|nr:hypothetical protein [Clostridia bacterium]